MYFVSYFFPFITVIFIIVTMTNLLQSSCIMLNKILSSEFNIVMSLITPGDVTSRLGANSWPNRLSAPSSHYCPGLRKPKNEDPIIRPYGSQRTANTSYAHFLCKKLTVQQYTYKSFTNFKYNYHRKVK